MIDYQVERHGYRKICNFLSDYDCEMLLSKFNKVEEKVTEFRPRIFAQQFKELSLKCDYLLSKQAAYPGLTFNKAWYVASDHKNSDFTKLPYIPHFDRERYFKIMIYLNDVTEENGAFSAAYTKVSEIEKYRLGLPSDYKEKGLNSYAPGGNAMMPVTGLKGDAVLFDTNTTHYAGSIQPGNVRKVLRLDFENPDWNSVFKQSKFQRLKQKLRLA